MKIFVNLLTTGRLLIALILPLLKNQISGLNFIITIALIFFTDTLDGKLSRKYNVQTLYGSMMDTLADKVVTIILMFMVFSRIKILILMIILEMIIVVTSAVGWICGKKVTVIMFGKIKMWLLCLSIITSYMNYFSVISDKITISLCTITCITQTIVLFKYITAIINQKPQKNKIFKFESAKELKYKLFDTKYYLEIIS